MDILVKCIFGLAVAIWLGWIMILVSLFYILDLENERHRKLIEWMLRILPSGIKEDYKRSSSYNKIK